MLVRTGCFGPFEEQPTTLTRMASRYKAFKLVGLQPVCAVTFTLGYALREYGAFNYLYTSTLNLIIFILSQVFIYACP